MFNSHSEKTSFSEVAIPELKDDNSRRTKSLGLTCWRKLDLSVLLVLTVIYLLSWLDRTNLGNARVAGLQGDLHLSNKQYSIALSVTFVPYVLVEIPVTLLLKAMGPNILLPMLLTLWGLVTTLQGFVRDYTGLLVCRFFLGLFEGWSGLLPAIILYLSYFYPRARLQQRLSVIFSASALAGAFSGLLAAGIMEMDGISGRPGWSWIFILEGLFTVAFGFFSFLLIPRSPEHCRLLNEDEKMHIARCLRDDGAVSKDVGLDSFSWLEVVRAFKLPHVWFLTIGALFNGIILYSLSYFTPSIVQGLGFKANKAQLMSVPPYVVAFVVTNIGSYIADKYQCRGAIFIFSASCSVVGFAMFLGSHQVGVQYGSLFLTITGINTLAPAMTSWVANNTSPHTRRATAVAAVCMTNNAGGILSTWLLGSLSAPPRYTTASIVLLVCSIGLGTSAVVNMVYLYYMNKKKASFRAVSTKEEEPRDLGDRSAWYIYIL
ncbi:hypothetical protein ONZ45_g11634 [Pleurotus djamor]|nr:hypothetical protein ONZ45_g11634 [Pleurotus djamor]